MAKLPCNLFESQGENFKKPLTIEYRWIAPIKKIEKVKESNIVST